MHLNNGICKCSAIKSGYRLCKNTGYYLSACSNRLGTICPHVQIDCVLFVLLCKNDGVLFLPGYYLSVTHKKLTQVTQGFLRQSCWLKSWPMKKILLGNQCWAIGNGNRYILTFVLAHKTIALPVRRHSEHCKPIIHSSTLLKCNLL